MSRFFKSAITRLDKLSVFTTVSGSLSAMLSVVIAFAAVVSKFVTLPDNADKFSTVATFNVLFSSSFNKPLRTKIFFTSVSLVPSCPANLAFAESLFAILSAIVSGSVSSLVAKFLSFNSVDVINPLVSTSSDTIFLKLLELRNAFVTVSSSICTSPFLSTFKEPSDFKISL